ncbi:hypothetical protein ACPRNU_21370 [Chromobacterium vaccinii]|uniref:hypothetical protein n=1 Tax=Chromobacterium vaccinii TaxID=1108595 RepID=UPI003C718CDD
MQKQPFSRAISFGHALAAISRLSVAQQVLARADLGHYQSRGKGLDRFSGRFDAKRMNRAVTAFNVPPGGGRRECARRARQQLV